ncbi:MAG: PHP domain-containing protein [Bacteroidales bacterium]|nr:PHP domain-containing protein [Bacteroidales bacterium]
METFKNNTMPKFDLHVHTTASDGSMDAKKIVAEAKSIGLTTMAITDHDTIGNVKECIEEGRKNGIRIIPGVELSAEIEHGKMHILGYGINPDDEEFNIEMEKLRKGRESRNETIIEVLKRNYNIEIKIDDVKKFAKGETIAKPHIASAIVEKYKNDFPDNETVFKKVIGQNDIESIERIKLTPKDCIDLINKAGGIAFLAHPNSLKLSEEMTFAKIKELKEYGLAGIEAYHSNCTPDQSATYVKMAKELGLMISCGSDFHGPEIKSNIKLGQGINGNLPTDNEEIVNGILKALKMI